VDAQVAAPAAIAAETAGEVAFAGDPVADREAAHLAAHIDDAAEVFVATAMGTEWSSAPTHPS